MEGGVQFGLGSLVQTGKRETKTELDQINMLNVEERLKQIKLKHVHDIFNSVGPSHLFDDFKRMNEHSVQNIRLLDATD